MHHLKTKIFSFFMALVVCTTAFALPPDWPEGGLIIEPDMGRDPLVAAFQDAKKSLRISAYKLEDPTLIAALKEAAERGIKVDVLVTRSIFKRADETEQGETPSETLKKIGLNVHQSPEWFAQTHDKFIIVDEDYALIGTGNMGTGSFDESADRKAERDFWITVTNKDQLEELERVFKADFNGEKIDLKNSLLVWSPDQERKPFLDLICSAKKSIFVYQQDIEDPVIAGALVEAARKGIDVRLIMTPHPFSKTKDGNIPHQEMIREAGGKAGLITHVITHAKVVLVDAGTKSEKVYLGSANFYPPSLDENREVGIITSDPAVTSKINAVFQADWKKADFTPRQPLE